MPVPSRRLAPACAAALLLAGVLGSCAAPASDGPGDTAVPASGAPAVTTSAPDPAVAAYCATVLRVQQEQTAPGAGQGGGASLTAAADTARRQVRDLAATAPPEIAGDWSQLSALTDQALASLTATGGDPNRIDRGALTRLQAQSQPAVDRIKQVTAQRCGITFRPPA